MIFQNLLYSMASVEYTSARNRAAVRDIISLSVHMVRCRLCSFDVVFNTLLHNAAIYSPCGDISISCPSMLRLLPLFAHSAVDL